MVDRDHVCAIIVTYNPPEDIFQVLTKHLLIFNKVIVIDNSSDNKTFNQLSPFCAANEALELIPLDKNYGIAYALNVGIKRGIDLLFPWIVSFDQDSVPSNFLLDYYNRVLESFEDNSKIGLVGVSFTCAGNTLIHNLITWKKSLSLITSGTLYNSAIFKKVGFFDEKLFIDGVDFEFNLRVRKANFLTFRIDQPLIEHNLGNPSEKKILFITVRSTNHSFERRYYMARNNIIITRQYFFHFPLWIIKKNLFFIKTIFQILLVEHNQNLKLSMIMKGVKDGISCKNLSMSNIQKTICR